jgi:hypothetical protein
VSSFVITVEILLAVVLPLIVLYLRSGWPLRTSTLCLVSIPVLWYFAYSPLHELSHVVATYLLGGTVTSMKLIPSFWRGEFGRAWITTVGVTETWQQLLVTASPYILDLTCVASGIALLRPGFCSKPFNVGFVLMILCLRPAFDFLCETIAFLSGDKGDVFHIAQVIGNVATGLFLLLSLGLCLFAVVTILARFRRADKSPEPPSELSADNKVLHSTRTDTRGS